MTGYEKLAAEHMAANPGHAARFDVNYAYCDTCGWRVLTDQKTGDKDKEPGPDTTGPESMSELFA